MKAKDFLGFDYLVLIHFVGFDHSTSQFFSLSHMHMKGEVEGLRHDTVKRGYY